MADEKGQKTRVSPATSALSRLFQIGIQAAQRADPGPSNDGGTCNLDSVAITCPRVHQSTIERAAEIAHTHATPFTWFGSRSYWVDIDAQGQGYRRTAMVKAAVDAMVKELMKMNRSTWHVSVYWQMD